MTMQNAQIADGEICEMVKIVNMRGLHARAAAKFVKLASGFNAEVQVAKEDVRVSGRSIMGLMMLAAGRGTVLKICVSGADSGEALVALADLIKRGFDET